MHLFKTLLEWVALAQPNFIVPFVKVKFKHKLSIFWNVSMFGILQLKCLKCHGNFSSVMSKF